MSTRAQVQGAFTETYRRYVRGPEQGADASDVGVADALHDAEERVMAVLPPEQRERVLEPGPDSCPTCGRPGYLVPGRGDNPDAFIPDEP